jgi:hypothetical protein
MAFTINRRNELKPSELNFIKRKFKQSTYSKAINECIKFVVFDSPDLERQNRKMKKKLKIAKQLGFLCIKFERL